MSEKAGIWLRVSGTGQDEENQREPVMRWVNDHGYDVAAEYVIHGHSAYRGNRKFDQAWAQVLDDMHTGKIDLLVTWKQNRLDRKLHTIQMLAQVVEAGARVEFTSQPHLNDLTTMGGRIALKVEEELAYAESKGKSDNVLLGQGRRRDQGSVVGRWCWGYEITCTVCDAPPRRPGCNQHKKIIVPTPEGRKFIPLIYRMVIDGHSLREVAAWLDGEGVRTITGKQWNENYLANRLLKNPTYYGARPNAGELEVEALVSFSEWQAANAAVATRSRPGRGTTTHEKALLAPVCGNSECREDRQARYDAAWAKQGRKGERPIAPEGNMPMYRTFTGGPRNRTPVYRCAGKGPQRKGCGNNLPMAELDTAVIEAMCEDTDARIERVFIPGDDVSDRIGKLRERGAQAMRDGDYDTATEYMHRAAELVAQPRSKPHWEGRYTCTTCGQIAPADYARCLLQGHHLLTEAEHFASLDRDGQRTELARWEISAYRNQDGEINFTMGPRDWADDADSSAERKPAPRHGRPLEVPGRLAFFRAK